MLDNFNPEMLTLARESRGATQSDIAAAVGCSVGLVSKWENGVSNPSPENIEIVSDHLGYPAALMYQGERVKGSDSICFHHRKRKSMPARLLSQVEAEMHLTQLQVRRLLRGLRIESTIDLPILDPDEHGGPRGVARLLRGYCRIPRGPIPNMVTLVEALGATVIVRDFQSRKLDGMSAWSKDAPPIFFLNEANPVDRSRWTIAHELGHLIMHQRITEGDPEDEADTFAQELLLPEDEVRADLRGLSFSRLASLKTYWKVSMKALITTADKLGVIPGQRAKSLYVQYSRAGYNQNEPFPLPPETPTVVADAIGVHLAQHDYTIPELAATIHLRPEEFVNLYGINTNGGRQPTLRIV